MLPLKKTCLHSSTSWCCNPCWASNIISL
jgi:hypothetical protein